jgi:hypothetical protein
MALGEFRRRESSSHAKSCPRLACTSANMFVLTSSGTATAASTCYAHVIPELLGNCAVAVSIRMAAGAVYSTGVQAMTEQGWNNVQRDVIKITWASPYEKNARIVCNHLFKNTNGEKKRTGWQTLLAMPLGRMQPKNKIELCSVLQHHEDILSTADRTFRNWQGIAKSCKTLAW